MLKPLTLLSASILAVTSFNAAANCDPGETVIKFSHVTNTDKHPKGIAASLLEKRVNEEMNGKVCMQVFPNSTLYDDDKVLEALLNGDVQLAAPSLSKFEKFTKKYRIFDLPFLFEDVEAVDRFQNSEAGEKLKNAMQRRGVQGLAFWHNGMKQMSASQPLLVPEDAKGLKFRVQASDVLVAQFEQLGANPQKMSFKEVYGGLQTKVIDGQENTWSNIYGKKFFEVQDGITETNHGILDYLVVTSNDFWNGLPDDQRDQLATIIKEVTDTRNAESSKVEMANKQYVIEAGAEVRELTPEQRQQWVDALKPVWKKFEKDIGADLIEAALASNK
ncbi:TRAP transporter substrate-binding protein [Vibrio scophthalmi]|jgi:C4-dicarboxylate-binding protein DctP|uniref:TRAP transporter substrate-binding protein n=1 Tax=Vibrio scophthalmi TaxID=45658 RepID=UPI002FEF4AA8